MRGFKSGCVAKTGGGKVESLCLYLTALPVQVQPVPCGWSSYKWGHYPALSSSCVVYAGISTIRCPTLAHSRDGKRTGLGCTPHNDLPLGAGVWTRIGEGMPPTLAPEQRLMASGSDVHRGQRHVDEVITCSNIFVLTAFSNLSKFVSSLLGGVPIENLCCFLQADFQTS